MFLKDMVTLSREIKLSCSVDLRFAAMVLWWFLQKVQTLEFIQIGKTSENTSEALLAEIYKFETHSKQINSKVSNLQAGVCAFRGCFVWSV